MKMAVKTFAWLVLCVAAVHAQSSFFSRFARRGGFIPQRPAPGRPAPPSPPSDVVAQLRLALNSDPMAQQKLRQVQARAAQAAQFVTSSTCDCPQSTCEEEPTLITTPTTVDPSVPPTATCVILSPEMGVVGTTCTVPTLGVGCDQALKCGCTGECAPGGSETTAILYGCLDLNPYFVLFDVGSEVVSTKCCCT